MKNKNYFFLVRLFYYFIILSVPVMADTCFYNGGTLGNITVEPCHATYLDRVYQNIEICNNRPSTYEFNVTPIFKQPLKNINLDSYSCYPYTETNSSINSNCSFSNKQTSSVLTLSTSGFTNGYNSKITFAGRSCTKYFFDFVPNEKDGKYDIKVQSGLLSFTLDPWFNASSNLTGDISNLDSKLMSWWTLDNNLSDSVGRNNLTNIGADNITAKINQGYYTNSVDTNDRLLLNNTLWSLVNGDFSVTMWVIVNSKPTSTYERFLEFTDGTDGVSIIYDVPANSLKVIQDRVGAGTDDGSANFAFNTNTWYHVVYSYNLSATTGIFYVNGVPKAVSLGDSGALGATPASLFGIRGDLNAVTKCNCSFDEIGVYNRTLYQNEAIALYNDNFGLSYRNISSTLINIVFDQRNPVLNSTNLFDKRYNVSYNITNGDTTTFQLYYNVTMNSSLEKIYTNGTSANIQGNRTYAYNITKTFYWFLDEFDIYHATYNYQESLMRNYTKQNKSIGATSSDLKQINFLNFSTNENSAFLEVNLIPGTSPLPIYYCNESNQNLLTNPKCVNIYNLQLAGESYHCHLNNISCHYVIPVVISNGKISGVNAVQSPSFILSGGAGWNIKYITNVSRVQAFRTSGNNGNTWSDDTGTPDSHIHSQTPDDVLTYYVCGNTTGGSSVCTSERKENFTLLRLPPTSPVVISPNSTTFDNQRIFINYTAAISQSNSILYYSIDLYNASNGLYATISANNSLNLNFTIANSSIFPNDNYYILVTAFDNESLSSIGISSTFTISNSVIPIPVSDTSVAINGFSQRIMYLFLMLLGLVAYFLSFKTDTEGSLILKLFSFGCVAMTGIFLPDARLVYITILFSTLILLNALLQMIKLLGDAK